MAHLRNGLILAGLLIAWPGLASAAEDYYTWVDENGITNYAERNPKGYDAKHITNKQRFGRRKQPSQPVPQSTPGPGASTASESPVDVDDAVADERAKVQADLARIKTENCNIGKQNLARLEAYSRIKVREANGEERFLTDAEKVQRTDEARALISDNCSG